MGNYKDKTDINHPISDQPDTNYNHEQMPGAFPVDQVKNSTESNQHQSHGSSKPTRRPRTVSYTGVGISEPKQIKEQNLHSNDGGNLNDPNSIEDSTTTKGQNIANQSHGNPTSQTGYVKVLTYEKADVHDLSNGYRPQHKPEPNYEYVPKEAFFSGGVSNASPSSINPAVKNKHEESFGSEPTHSKKDASHVTAYDQGIGNLSDSNTNSQPIQEIDDNSQNAGLFGVVKNFWSGPSKDEVESDDTAGVQTIDPKNTTTKPFVTHDLGTQSYAGETGAQDTYPNPTSADPKADAVASAAGTTSGTRGYSQTAGRGYPNHGTAPTSGSKTGVATRGSSKPTGNNYSNHTTTATNTTNGDFATAGAAAAVGSAGLYGDKPDKETKQTTYDHPKNISNKQGFKKVQGTTAANETHLSSHKAQPLQQNVNTSSATHYNPNTTGISTGTVGTTTKYGTNHEIDTCSGKYDNISEQNHNQDNYNGSLDSWSAEQNAQFQSKPSWKKRASLVFGRHKSKKSIDDDDLLGDQGIDNDVVLTHGHSSNRKNTIDHEQNESQFPPVGRGDGYQNLDHTNDHYNSKKLEDLTNTNIENTKKYNAQVAPNYARNLNNTQSSEAYEIDSTKPKLETPNDDDDFYDTHAPPSSTHHGPTSNKKEVNIDSKTSGKTSGGAEFDGLATTKKSQVITHPLTDVLSAEEERKVDLEIKDREEKGLPIQGESLDVNKANVNTSAKDGVLELPVYNNPIKKSSTPVTTTSDPSNANSGHNNQRSTSDPSHSNIDGKNQISTYDPSHSNIDGRNQISTSDHVNQGDIQSTNIATATDNDDAASQPGLKDKLYNVFGWGNEEVEENSKGEDSTDFQKKTAGDSTDKSESQSGYKEKAATSHLGYVQQAEIAVASAIGGTAIGNAVGVPDPSEAVSKVNPQSNSQDKESTKGSKESAEDSTNEPGLKDKAYNALGLNKDESNDEKSSSNLKDFNQKDVNSKDLKNKAQSGATSHLGYTQQAEIAVASAIGGTAIGNAVGIPDPHEAVSKVNHSKESTVEPTSNKTGVEGHSKPRRASNTSQGSRSSWKQRVGSFFGGSTNDEDSNELPNDSQKSSNKEDLRNSKSKQQPTPTNVKDVHNSVESPSLVQSSLGAIGLGGAAGTGTTNRNEGRRSSWKGDAPQTGFVQDSESAIPKRSTNVNYQSDNHIHDNTNWKQRAPSTGFAGSKSSLVEDETSDPPTSNVGFKDRVAATVASSAVGVAGLVGYNATLEKKPDATDDSDNLYPQNLTEDGDGKPVHKSRQPTGTNASNTAVIGAAGVGPSVIGSRNLDSHTKKNNVDNSVAKEPVSKHSRRKSSIVSVDHENAIQNSRHKNDFKNVVPVKQTEVGTLYAASGSGTRDLTQEYILVEPVSGKQGHSSGKEAKHNRRSSATSFFSRKGSKDDDGIDEGHLQNDESTRRRSRSRSTKERVIGLFSSKKSKSRRRSSAQREGISGDEAIHGDTSDSRGYNAPPDSPIAYTQKTAGEEHYVHSTPTGRPLDYGQTPKNHHDQTLAVPQLAPVTQTIVKDGGTNNQNINAL